MKFQMNFTTSYDDVIRFGSAEELQQFYTEHGCTGLEVMPLGYSTKDAPDVYLSAEECPLIRPEMVTGVHCCCSGDWIASDRQTGILIMPHAWVRNMWCFMWCRWMMKRG